MSLMIQRAGLLTCAGALAFAGGCHPAGKTGGAGAAGTAGADAGAAKIAAAQESAIAQSQIREKALTLLGDMSQSTEPEDRYNAIESLIPVPSRLEAAVRRGVLDPDDRVRIVAAMAVGKTKMVRMVEFVRPLLKERSEMVQAAAIFALARCGESVDQQPLAALLQHERPLFRAHAAYILGEMGNVSALSMVRDAARDPMTRSSPAQVRIYRLQLAEAMIKLGDETAVHEVRAALYPSRPDELEATALAAQILGQVRDQASAAQLMHLTTMNDPQAGKMPAEVRLAAAASLAKLGHTEGSFVGDEYRQDKLPPIRAQVALLYGETGRKSNLPALGTMMDDPDPIVRLAAAAGVLKITDREANRTGGRTASAGER